MSLTDQIMSDMKQAMKAHDQATLNTVRMIKASLINEKIKAGRNLNADEELTVLNREKKQREESLIDFEKAKRADLIAETKQELAVIEGYLPKQLSAAELDQIVKQTITEIGATTKADFGTVMKALMPKIKGRTDGKKAAQAVQSKLK